MVDCGYWVVGVKGWVFRQNKQNKNTFCLLFIMFQVLGLGLWVDSGQDYQCWGEKKWSEGFWIVDLG